MFYFLNRNINDTITFDHKLPTLNPSVLDQYKNEKDCQEFKKIIAEDIADYLSIIKDSTNAESSFELLNITINHIEAVNILFDIHSLSNLSSLLQ